MCCCPFQFLCNPSQKIIWALNLNIAMDAYTHLWIWVKVKNVCNWWFFGH
jgi:hypothetical protein